MMNDACCFETFRKGDRVLTPLGRAARVAGWIGDRLHLIYADAKRSDDGVLLLPDLVTHAPTFKRAA